MISFDEAKSKLKDLLQGSGLILADEHDRELFFKVSNSEVGLLAVPESEIIEFQQVSDVISHVKTSPVETSIIGTNFREQLVDFTGSARTAFFSFREHAITFRNEDDQGVSVEIGTASPIFFNYFRFQKERMSFLLERTNRLALVARVNAGRMSMRDLLPRLLTIKINYSEPQTEKDLKDVTEIFESCLFELSYI